MDSSVEISVRDRWKGDTTISCDYSCAWDLHNHWLRFPMRIAQYKPREFKLGSDLFSHWIAQWRQANSGGYLNPWLVQIWASLCVAGGDSTEYLWGVLYYVLLHVLYHYNIHIVRGFQLYAFSIPPFLGMHPVFNVDCLRPYFPPFLDTSHIAEQLTPTELNPDCMEKATIDRIMDIHAKKTWQQRIQPYRVVKAGQLLHQGK